MRTVVPAAPKDGTMLAGKIPVAWSIRFRYEDGPRDCEAVGVDVPMTWEQLSEIAVALSNPDEGTYGMVLNPTLDNIIPWIWSNGGEVFSEDRSKALIGEPAAVEAVSFLSDLVHNKKAVLPITDRVKAWEHYDVQFYMFTKEGKPAPASTTSRYTGSAHPALVSSS